MAIRQLLFYVVLTVGLYTQPVFAADESIKPSQSPVAVTSDSLEADEATGSLVFIGNAVATQEDFTITADRLTLFYSSETREIKEILAEGHVRITQEQRQATSDRAVFNRLEENIILTGNPRVSEEGNSVEGQIITLYLKDRRSIVKGGEGGRVNAVFQPQEMRTP